MILTESNFLIYAAHYYDNPNCISSDEFLEDLNRIKYLKKLFYNYKNKNILRERLILNHLLVLYNIFENKALTRMLFFKLEDYWEFLAPFLSYLGYLPNVIDGIEDRVIICEKIVHDKKIILQLEEIEKERKNVV